MEPSKVYFCDLHTHMGDGLPNKLKRLIKAAGIGQIDFENKFVAIKMHLGEPGNLSYLRPNYARAVVDVVRELGGKPFITDCNTLYVGGRKNALDHLDSAYANGFNPFQTGCHTIIADGLRGLAASTSKTPRSAAPSWMPTWSSASPTSRATSGPALAAP